MPLLLDDANKAAAHTNCDNVVPRGMPQRQTWKRRASIAAARMLTRCFGPRLTDAFGILMYHRIADPVPGLLPPTWNVPPALFEQQLVGLLRRGWRPMPLREVLECAAAQRPPGTMTFVVTFDDGYANNWLNAYPVLERLGVPATLFLATAYLDSDQPFPSDDWPAAGHPNAPVEAWRPLTTEECRRLIATGLVELGTHTHTHADFRGRPAALVADLKQNIVILRERFGVERPAFALPYGTQSDGFASAELIAAAREAGAACCLTTEPNVVRAGESPFGWGRFAATDHDSPGSLAAQLNGWHEALRKAARLSSQKLKTEN
jgi:peptidoglycan/xylan/chitin deacetylase (PgdA/CDA1 family)